MNKLSQKFQLAKLMIKNEKEKKKKRKKKNPLVLG